MINEMQNARHPVGPPPGSTGREAGPARGDILTSSGELPRFELAEKYQVPTCAQNARRPEPAGS